MPRKKTIPKVKYVPVEGADPAILNEVFDYLFNKLFSKQKSLAGRPHKSKDTWQDPQS